MAERKKENQINLLPREAVVTSTRGRVLAWVLSTFRIIVIVTEIIVMVGFLSRFWLDATNTDLDEQLEQKRIILASSSNFEKEFKDKQKRVKIFSSLAGDEGLISNTLSSVSSYLPPDILLESFTFGNAEAEISGLSPNEKSIQQLIVNLTSSGLFKEVSLNEVSTNPKNVSLMVFRIKIVLKERS